MSFSTYGWRGLDKIERATAVLAKQMKQKTPKSHKRTRKKVPLNFPEATSVPSTNNLAVPAASAVNATCPQHPGVKMPPCKERPLVRSPAYMSTCTTDRRRSGGRQVRRGRHMRRLGRRQGGGSSLACPHTQKYVSVCANSYLYSSME